MSIGASRVRLFFKRVSLGLALILIQGLRSGEKKATRKITDFPTFPAELGRTFFRVAHSREGVNRKCTAAPSTARIDGSRAT